MDFSRVTGIVTLYLPQMTLFSIAFVFLLGIVSRYLYAVIFIRILSTDSDTHFLKTQISIFRVITVLVRWHFLYLYHVYLLKNPHNDK